MKTFNLAVSRKKRNNHIVNIVILTALYFMGLWLGKHYFQRYSPYTVAYTIPSLVVGLVVCKRFSDKVRAYLHPHTKSKVTVYNYGNDYDSSMGVVGILFKYAFYTFIGFFIFPVYYIWAAVTIVWLTFSIYRNQHANNGMAEDIYYSPMPNEINNEYI